MQHRKCSCLRASIPHWATLRLVPPRLPAATPSLPAATPMAALQVPPEDTTLRGVTMERLIEVVPQVSLCAGLDCPSGLHAVGW